MSTLNRRNPSRDLVSLHDAMDRLFEDTVIHSRAFWDYAEGGASIPLDLYEEGNNLVVKASVPGVKPEELNIQVEYDVLTILGEMKKDEEHKDQDYYLREHHYGRFSRSLELPRSVDANKAEAVFANGVLTITLPKADESRGKRIQVKTK